MDRAVTRSSAGVASMTGGNGETRHWIELARRIFADSRWLLAFDVAPGATRLVAQLSELGAPRCFVVAGAEGAGRPPSAAGAELSILDVHGDGPMNGLRAAERAFGALPRDVRRRIDDWDPERAARSMGPPYAEGRDVADRPFFGARPAKWKALENKTTIDALWGELGVPRAPSAIVPVE